MTAHALSAAQHRDQLPSPRRDSGSSRGANSKEAWHVERCGPSTFRPDPSSQTRRISQRLPAAQAPRLQHQRGIERFEAATVEHGREAIKHQLLNLIPWQVERAGPMPREHFYFPLDAGLPVCERCEDPACVWWERAEQRFLWHLKGVRRRVTIHNQHGTSFKLTRTTLLRLELNHQVRAEAETPLRSAFRVPSQYPLTQLHEHGARRYHSEVCVFDEVDADHRASALVPMARASATTDAASGANVASIESISAVSSSSATVQAFTSSASSTRAMARRRLINTNWSNEAAHSLAESLCAISKSKTRFLRLSSALMRCRSFRCIVTCPIPNPEKSPATPGQGVAGVVVSRRHALETWPLRLALPSAQTPSTTRSRIPHKQVDFSPRRCVPPCTSLLGSRDRRSSGSLHRPTRAPRRALSTNGSSSSRCVLRLRCTRRLK